jgi:hypothetical protein
MHSIQYPSPVAAQTGPSLCRSNQRKRARAQEQYCGRQGAALLRTPLSMTGGSIADAVYGAKDISAKHIDNDNTIGG